MPQFDPELYALQPWYHDFSSLSLDTTFLDLPLTPAERAQRAIQLAASKLRRIWPGPRTSGVPQEGVRSIKEVFNRLPTPHLANQPVKEKHILGFIRQALSDLPPAPTCLDLFCADGYYSCHIKRLAPSASVTGIELDEGHARRAATIAQRLQLQDVTFHREDVSSFLERSPGPYELVLCAGGLYHIPAPSRLLEKVGHVALRYVVIQSVVTLETEDPDYFVEPAPGWQHGCRFTHAWLREQAAGLGWRILAESKAELPGNQNLRDRGSSFLLCAVHQGP